MQPKGRVSAESIARIARDPGCYPPLDRRQDFMQNDMTFAQRLKYHIDSVLDERFIHEAEDPTHILIY